jgi:hypothetical protein
VTRTADSRWPLPPVKPFCTATPVHAASTPGQGGNGCSLEDRKSPGYPPRPGLLLSFRRLTAALYGSGVRQAFPVAGKPPAAAVRHSYMQVRRKRDAGPACSSAGVQMPADGRQARRERGTGQTGRCGRGAGPAKLPGGRDTITGVLGLGQNADSSSVGLFPVPEPLPPSPPRRLRFRRGRCRHVLAGLVRLAGLPLAQHLGQGGVYDAAPACPALQSGAEIGGSSVDAPDAPVSASGSGISSSRPCGRCRPACGA